MSPPPSICRPRSSVLRSWAAATATMLAVACIGCEALLDFDDVRYDSNSTSSTSSGSSSGSGGDPSSCLSASPELSETFTDEDAFWSRWRTLAPLDDHHLQLQTTVPPGFLELWVGLQNNEPNYVWDVDQQAPFFYQTICGDFAFIVELNADDGTNMQNPVQLEDTGAGILLRDGQSEDEHWLRMTLGYLSKELQTGVGFIHLQDKMLRIGPSVPTYTLGHMHMAVCRIDEKIYGFIKPSSSSELQAITLPTDVDLPDQLQVGFTSMRRYNAQTRLRLFHAQFDAPLDATHCGLLLEGSLDF